MPNAVVTVVSGGVSVEGVADTKTDNSDFSEYGESGLKAGTVRVNAGELDAPAIGDAITVGGVDVFVDAVRTDSSGALHAIQYSEQSNVE